ncbi:putative laccase-11 isoform X2 [Agrilus planipennis]|nr:putative laccase-11 isoform X2 [Agrilus planipennis]
MENGKDKMYEVRNVYFRIGIVLGMLAAVITIVYFTPMPEEYFLSCDRPCHHLDWPMICRVKMKIEILQYQTVFCENCSSNSTSCRSICLRNRLHSTITTNNQIPGPALHVCQNDIIVVDVLNAIPGKSLTLHWRGQPQNEMPLMDGVPMITQCSIPGYTTFQYKFRVTSPGTHIWHAHSGSDIADGVFGALVVRQPHKFDFHKKFYDYDLKEHTLVISEGGDENSIKNHYSPRALMINGASSNSGKETHTFTVKQGKRYRFRVAYVGGLFNCPVQISLDNHILKIVSLDGNPVLPFEASSIDLMKGERVDFIVNAKVNEGSHLLRITSLLCYESVREVNALVKYNNGEATGNENKKLSNPSYIRPSATISAQEQRNFSTRPCESKVGHLCVETAKSASKMPAQLKTERVDRKIYLAINRNTDAGGNQKQLLSTSRVYSMNNITFVYPSSPLLSQYEDIPGNLKCNLYRKPSSCLNDTTCPCVHIEEIPTGSSVEVTIIDQVGDSKENVFHLHGYHFYVVGSTNLEKSMELENIKELDSKGKLFKRNLESPVLKDTIRIPKYGAVSFRFIADNPGFWILRDEMSLEWTRGMDVVFHIGSCCDMPSIPSNFPKCGNWVGPEFFLL